MNLDNLHSNAEFNATINAIVCIALGLGDNEISAYVEGHSCLLSDTGVGGNQFAIVGLNLSACNEDIKQAYQNFIEVLEQNTKVSCED